MSITSTPGRGQRSRRQRISDDLKNVETGIRCYHREGRDNPRLLEGLLERKRELEAALRRTPADEPPRRWGGP